MTFIQRFGSALNLNIHFHMLAPDGAYTFANGQARYHRAPAPSEFELERLFDTLIRRITRTQVRTGVLVESPEYPWLDIHPDNGGDNALEQLAGAAVRYSIAVGPIAGRKTMTLRSPVNLSGECASIGFGITDCLPPMRNIVTSLLQAPRRHQHLITVSTTPREVPANPSPQPR